MEGKSFMYVAGNPNSYPIEYYNEDTQTYEGVIPQLLREFSEQSGYEIIYYLADGGDHREQFAKNRQVDVLSGYMRGETIPENEGSITLFSTEYADTEYVYCLYVTHTAPKGFQEELENFVATVSQKEVSGILMDTAVESHDNHADFWEISSLVLVIILLITAMLLLMRRYHKKLKQMQWNVESDKITGLGNLDYFSRYYKQFVNDKNRILYQLFYFYVDTDRMRRISSSEETDQFLQYCAVVLKEHISDTDILARASDHGFVVLKLTSNPVQSKMWVCTLLERIRSYSRIYAKPFEAEANVGIYSLKQQDRNLEEIIFQAFQSAVLASREGEEFICCSDQMLQKFVQEKQLQASMDQAFLSREFCLYIQFYIDIQSYKIVGGEALSRWNHPQKGLLMPNTFVPLMEREKMISKLDYYCLQEVCSFLQRLKEEEIDTFFVSCNFSRETFAAVDFVERVKELINPYTFPRELLIFEITESISVKNVAQIQNNIIELKQYGIQIALDDFGEGFTSFYDLQKYPIDGIKLDKGLVDQMMTPSGAAILKAMIQVGHELDMTILAEGVETEEQVQMLREIQCDVIQGYHFYFPLPEWDANKKILEQFSNETYKKQLARA